MSETHVMDLFRLDGKVALITGGSKGLGASMAMGLAQAGAKTAICSRTQADCDRVSAEIAEETEQESLGIAGDVTSEKDVDRVFDTVIEKYGKLDVLINSAGINIRHPVEDFPLDEFKQVIDINLTGVWLCCRAAARVMKPQGSGSVVNIRVGIKRRRVKRAVGLLFVKSGTNRHDKNDGSGMGRIQCALQCPVSRPLFDRDQCTASKNARESEVVVGINGIKSLG